MLFRNLKKETKYLLKLSSQKIMDNTDVDVIVDN